MWPETLKDDPWSAANEIPSDVPSPSSPSERPPSPLVNQGPLRSLTDIPVTGNAEYSAPDLHKVRRIDQHWRPGLGESHEIPTGGYCITNLDALKKDALCTKDVSECIFFVAYNDAGTAAVFHLYRDDKDVLLKTMGLSLAELLPPDLRTGKVQVVALGGNFNDLVLPVKKDFSDPRLIVTDFSGQPMDYASYRKERMDFAGHVYGIGINTLSGDELGKLRAMILKGKLFASAPREWVAKLYKEAHILLKPNPQCETFHEHQTAGDFPLELRNTVGDRNYRLMEHMFRGADTTFRHFYTEPGCNVSVKVVGDSLGFTISHPKTGREERLVLPLTPSAALQG